MTMPAKPTGRIITFYSYKGGTGRTMALANVGWIIASRGWRVLLVDWDLEAPGLHRYLHPFLVDKELERTEGLIDCIIEYTTETVTRRDDAGPDNAKWAERYANILRYVTTLKGTFKDPGRLDLLGAGRQDAAYSTKVNTFDWKSFYERHGGGAFLDLVKERMRVEYDYVLIDSRTGVSDTSGICTLHMPDDLVVCFTLNNQSIVGASRVALAAIEQRGAAGLRVFPVPTRVEQGEKEKLDTRLRYARRRFGLLPSDLDPGRREQYWGDVEFLYVPYYAYEEMLAPFGDEPSRTSSLLASAERLAAYLTGVPTKLVPPDEAERHRVLRMYALAGSEGAEGGDPATVAERIHEGLSPTDQATARRLFLRLVRVPGPGETAPDTPTPLPLTALDRECQAVAQGFLAAGVLVTDSSGREPVLQIAQAPLIQQWGRLREWLDGERAFLEWRQKLRANVADWEHNKQDAGVLLSGGPLGAARKWSMARTADLTPAELEYIRRSLKVSRRKSAFAAVVTLLVLAMGVWSGSRSGAVRTGESELSRAFTLVVRGDSVLGRGRPDSAAALYQQAIALKPDYALAYLKRGRLLDAKGDSAKALADFNQALRLQDTLAAAWFARADFYGRRGLDGLAIADLERGLTYDTANAAAYLRLGHAQEGLGQTLPAIDHYSKSIALLPTPDAYLSRGMAYTRVKNRASAAADYREVVRIATDTQDIIVAQARLRQLGAGGTPVPLPVAVAPRRILLFYRDRADGRLVTELTRMLDSLHYTVGDPVMRLDRLYSAVVYFSSANEKGAVQVRDAVQLRLATHGLKVDLQLLYRDPATATGVTAGDIAVWLPSLGRNSSQAF
jgi:tetratricopeptide (TPR) repeat protein/cellulose biosynthesis protein BcsQ